MPGGSDPPRGGRRRRDRGNGAWGAPLLVPVVAPPPSGGQPPPPGAAHLLFLKKTGFAWVVPLLLTGKGEPTGLLLARTMSARRRSLAWGLREGEIFLPKYHSTELVKYTRARGTVIFGRKNKNKNTDCPRIIVLSVDFRLVGFWLKVKCAEAITMSQHPTAKFNVSPN